MIAKSPLPKNKMSVVERREFLKKVAKEYNLTHLEIAELLGYSHDTVMSWFTDPTSARHRPITQRAVDRLKTEIEAGRVKGSKY